MISYSICLAVRLSSLGIMSARFIHVSQVTGSPSFSWLNNISLHIQIISSLSIHPLTGNLDCFHMLAIVNDVTITVTVHVSIRYPVFLSFEDISHSGIAGPYSRYFYIFEEAPYSFPQWLHQSAFPPTIYEGSLFSTCITSFYFNYYLFKGPIPIYSHILRYWRLRPQYMNFMGTQFSP